MNSDLYTQALRFATAYHAGQKRKYTGEDYITHPVAVAGIVRSVSTHTEQMLAAALLHDVVEDTSATLDDISTNFGFDVALMVYYLTDISRPEDGNRATRKELDANHIARAPGDVQTIKVADLIHNTACISKHDPGFWEIYKVEKRRLLNLLTDADILLWARADEQLKRLW